VQGSSSVFQMKFGAENPPLRKAANVSGNIARHDTLTRHHILKNTTI